MVYSMDDSLIISHVENECAPTISLLQSVVITPYGYKSLDVLRMSD